MYYAIWMVKGLVGLGYNRLVFVKLKAKVAANAAMPKQKAIFGKRDNLPWSRAGGLRVKADIAIS
jgi:hypothetical protein